MIELQAYAENLLLTTDNTHRIFGVINYAPVDDFDPNAEFFVRQDGTITPSSAPLKSGKNWLRASQIIYQNRLSVSQARDTQGISYRTILAGLYAAHSAGVAKELDVLVKTPLILNVKTASGEFIIGTPHYPVRLQYEYQNLNAYQFNWVNVSPRPLRGFTNNAVFLPSNGNGAISQEAYVSYRTMPNLAALNAASTGNLLANPAVYYIQSLNTVYFAYAPNQYVSMAGTGGNLQVLRHEFTLSPSVNSFTVSGFTVSDSDTNVLVFLGGTLRNKGNSKDYTISAGNTVTWAYPLTEQITGVVIKIIL